jgi:hypothetical protein
MPEVTSEEPEASEHAVAEPDASESAADARTAASAAGDAEETSEITVEEAELTPTAEELLPAVDTVPTSTEELPATEEPAADVVVTSAAAQQAAAQHDELEDWMLEMLELHEPHPVQETAAEASPAPQDQVATPSAEPVEAPAFQATEIDEEATAVVDEAEEAPPEAVPEPPAAPPADSEPVATEPQPEPEQPETAEAEPAAEAPPVFDPVSIEASLLAAFGPPPPAPLLPPSAEPGVPAEPAGAPSQQQQAPPAEPAEDDQWRNSKVAAVKPGAFTPEAMEAAPLEEIVDNSALAARLSAVLDAAAASIQPTPPRPKAETENEPGLTVVEVPGFAAGGLAEAVIGQTEPSANGTPRFNISGFGAPPPEDEDRPLNGEG